MPTFKDKVRLPDAVCLRATGAAILVEVDDVQVWIPQSEIDDDSEVWGEGDEGTLVISGWIAKRKDLA